MSTAHSVVNVTDQLDYRPSIRVRYGAGALSELGSLAAELGGKRALLVTDEGLVEAGHAPRAVEILAEAGIEVFLYDRVQENPTSAHVEDCRDFALAAGGVDLIVGLGGGSAMDCAKGTNFLVSNGGEMKDYWGKGLAIQPMLPSIGIPTTAGTGSEAQCFALISDAVTHRKMACGDLKARFRTVILDPELLTSVPRTVAAQTGMDAVTHAIESYVTKARNPISQMFAREAWRLLTRNLERVLADPGDIEAWGNMLLGAHYSGSAIECSMLGAAHACANPLTARFDVIHGTAVALMLPHVVAYNGEAVGPLYEALCEVAGLDGPDEPSARLAARLTELRAHAGLPGTLSELGIDAHAIPGLAEDAKTQWTGNFNPRPVAVEDFAALFEAAL